MNKALPELFHPSSTNFDITTVPHPTFIQHAMHLSSSHAIQTVNSNVCINSFSCPTDNFDIEILYLFCPHVEIFPTKTPFVIHNHIFDTDRNLQKLSQLHINDIQTLTLYTFHVNGISLKNLFSSKLLLKSLTLHNLSSFLLSLLHI